MSKGWPKTTAFGQFNEMALCEGCNRGATQTRITYYVLDALDGGPYLCDECRTKEIPPAEADGGQQRIAGGETEGNTQCT